MKLGIIFNIFILISIIVGKPNPTPKPTPKAKPQLGLPNLGGGGSFGGMNNGYGGVDLGFGGTNNNNGFGGSDPGFGEMNKNNGAGGFGFANPFNSNKGSAKQQLLQKLKEMLDILSSFDGGIGGPGGFLGPGTGFGTGLLPMNPPLKMLEKKKKEKGMN